MDAVTCYHDKNNQMLVTLNDRTDSDDFFMKEIERKHGNGKIAREYRLLMKVARSRLGL